MRLYPLTYFSIFVCKACGSNLVLFTSKKIIQFNNRARKELANECES